MDILEYDFDIKTLGQELGFGDEALYDMRVSSYYNDNLKLHVFNAFRHFASSRPILETKEQVEYTEVTKPKSSVINYFRLLVTRFCPSLNFGWLSPEYYTVKIRCEAKYFTYNYNLYPITEEDYRKQFGLKWRTAEISKPSTVDWLVKCVPYSASMRQQNVTDSYEVCDDYRRELKN